MRQCGSDAPSVAGQSSSVRDAQEQAERRASIAAQLCDTARQQQISRPIPPSATAQHFCIHSDGEDSASLPDCSRAKFLQSLRSQARTDPEGVLTLRPTSSRDSTAAQRRLAPPAASPKQGSSSRVMQTGIAGAIRRLISSPINGAATKPTRVPPGN